MAKQFLNHIEVAHFYPSNISTIKFAKWNLKNLIRGAYLHVLGSHITLARDSRCFTSSDNEYNYFEMNDDSVNILTL